MSITTLAFSLLQQAAFLSLAVVLHWLVDQRTGIRSWLRQLAIGVVFGAVGGMTMAEAVVMGSGYLFDMRMAAIALSGPAGGPLAIIVSTAILMGVRASLGGAGVYMGVIATAMGGLIALLFMGWLKRAGREFSWRDLPLLGLAIVIPNILVTPLAPHDMAMRFLRDLALPVSLANFFGVVFAGSLNLMRNERSRARIALAASEARLRAIADNLPGALFERRKPAHGPSRYTYVSSGVKTLLGVGPSELTTLTKTRLLNLDDRTRYRQLQAEALKDMSPIVFETRYVDAHRHGGWLRLFASPRREGDEIVWTGFAHDITEEKRLETLAAEAEAEKRATLARLADEFESGAGRALHILQASVGKMAASAVDVTASTQDTVIRAKDAVRDAETTNAHVHALVENTQLLDATAADIASQSRRNADGARRMGETFALAQTSVADLRQASGRIDAAVKAVQALASRTNLNALDAAVAAVRKAQAGDGFAAAAGDLKDFAAEAERVSAQITARIGDVHAAAERATEALRALDPEMTEMQRGAADVADGSDSQRDTMRAIHEGTRDAAASTGDVCSNMAAVAMQAEEAGTAASNLMNAVTVLNHQTDALVEHVERFVRHVKAA
jgi:PAS domain S-box-containing protein